MYYVSEQMARDLVDQDAVTDAVSASFVALASDDATCFPVVRETLGHADATFGLKSGFDRAAPALRCKTWRRLAWPSKPRPTPAGLWYWMSLDELG